MQKGAAAGKLMFLLCAQFFKDRHYLDKEWGHYIGGKVEETENATCNSCNRVVLEVSHFSLILCFPCSRCSSFFLLLGSFLLFCVCLVLVGVFHFLALFPSFFLFVLFWSYFFLG
jgi:hypothetical protein